ncbi:MAG: asparagine synthetase B, partial [Bacteroidetes bacterium]|nr:asparagine synthetase B [Bacteroidota bacterium]
MCGVTGIYAFNDNGKTYLDKTADAAKTLIQRGPDGHGIYTDRNIALGHTRLAVIDPTEAGAQPFSDNTGRYTIVFNGEFYNFREHRNKLGKEGFTFRSASDTEVLLNLYIQKGPSCLDDINGCFAFAVYDKTEESLFIARDRMGINPMLYYLDSDKLIFGSEMKALLAFGIPRKIDTASLYTYLQL